MKTPIFYTFTNKNMTRDYKFLAIYKWHWRFIYRIKGKYYLENRKQVTRDEFIYIG